MFATIRQTVELLESAKTISLVSGPDDLPPGPGPWGGAVSQGDLWGDYRAVGTGERGILCAPEKDAANMC